jgi:hypothetical protein
MTQEEPAFPGVKVEPEIVHVPDTTEYVTTPFPEPPMAPNERVCPYVTEFDDNEIDA